MKFAITSAALAAAVIAMPAAAQEATPDAGPDAATVAQAREAAAHILPDGTYARMMEGTFEQLMDQIMASVMDMPMGDLAAMGGIAPEEMAGIETGTMREMMAIIDPHYEERQKISIRIMMEDMVGLMTQMEPAMREGLGDAYANRFSADELAQLNAFFDTPVGRKYAANSLSIFMDPAFMSKTQEMMPQLMKAMPGIVEQMQEATADLPPARSIDELSDEEREKLAAVMGRAVDAED
ncbi:DUF2059 domain-containing protein [Croceicoccus mobilis]|uniref:DUF2059 domain-containing protein n=1 Tax=Croceicoccus mobilis TaxID=1703339 RepID=A0A916YS72_9SPHN|nr:DUF2059 domain-containing protein [Croceicoccus mobilis]GGD59049.1 hypothetical protein GCM10010990_05420 [Croceicoccus mobilis]